MVDRFCGPGGNDGNSGLTWALRKLTLNGVEDTPVVAGDDVYVGPGVYRELLTLDVSGGIGNIITYIGDVTGENTDGVGGVVRITGSDNDQTAVRTNCIFANSRNYRTFCGFVYDTLTSHNINIVDCEHWIVEDCSFEIFGGAVAGILCDGAGQSNFTARRLFLQGGGFGIWFNHSVAVNNSGHLVENCIINGGIGDGIQIRNVGQVVIQNCTIIDRGDDSIDVTAALAGGQNATVENCLLLWHRQYALEAALLGDIVEDFNGFWTGALNRLNVAVGANSVNYPPLFEANPLFSGIRYAQWRQSRLSQWSQVRALTDSGNVPADDFFGVTRPVTNGKRSWGAIQRVDSERETGTVRTGTASIVLHDAGRHQIFVPIDGAQSTISVWVYREANYAGNLPQMLIKQPGQADRVTTQAGAVGAWEALTDTFTPAALPTYVVVELVSRNTAAALAYDVFFDDLVVT